MELPGGLFRGFSAHLGPVAKGERPPLLEGPMGPKKWGPFLGATREGFPQKPKKPPQKSARHLRLCVSRKLYTPHKRSLRASMRALRVFLGETPLVGDPFYKTLSSPPREQNFFFSPGGGPSPLSKPRGRLAVSL